jgi:alpha-D-xyloside xylohydrolase
MRSFTKLKNRLMPYLYGAAVEAHERGADDAGDVPRVPRRPGLLHLDRQYMLGENLLVRPVFSESGAVTYYVPAGSGRTC